MKAYDYTDCGNCPAPSRMYLWRRGRLGSEVVGFCSWGCSVGWRRLIEHQRVDDGENFYFDQAHMIARVVLREVPPEPRPYQPSLLIGAVA